MASSYLQNWPLLLSLVASVKAYTLFETACSIPGPHVNFVSSPNSRGTLDILWSSLFMIIACTWVVQHLNVPEQRNGRDPGLVGDLKWKLKVLLQNTKWMIITMIAPEYIIGIACVELLSAMEAHQKLRKFALEDQVPWTLTHTYYANMGGFVIRIENQEDVYAIPPAENVLTDKHPGEVHMSETHALEAIDNNKAVQEFHPTTDSQNVGSYHNPYHLRAMQIYELRLDKRYLLKLPYISEEELGDKSNSDYFVKLIAILQIIWAIAQIIVRAIRKIAISQLELAVIAFAICAVIIYLLYWPKPKNIGAVTTILQYQGQIPKDVLRLIDTDSKSYITAFLGRGTWRTKRCGSCVPNDNLEGVGNDIGGLGTVVMILGATLFGGIHIGAWNFKFPSRIELIFWRCASTFSASYGLITLACMFVMGLDTLGRYFIIPFWTFTYIIARLFLLIEIFRTLCFLPPDAYISTWTANIPHVT